MWGSIGSGHSRFGRQMQCRPARHWKRVRYGAETRSHLAALALAGTSARCSPNPGPGRDGLLGLQAIQWGGWMSSATSEFHLPYPHIPSKCWYLAAVGNQYDMPISEIVRQERHGDSVLKRPPRPGLSPPVRAQLGTTGRFQPHFRHGTHGCAPPLNSPRKSRRKLTVEVINVGHTISLV